MVLRSADPVASVEWWTRNFGLEPLRVRHLRLQRCSCDSSKLHPSLPLRPGNITPPPPRQIHQQVSDYQAGKVPFPSVRVSGSFLIDFAGKEMAKLAAATNRPDKPDDTAAAAASTTTPPAVAPAAGQLDHLCLCLEDGLDMEEVAARLDAAGVPPLQQFDGKVVGRFGARGSAKSVYVRTPEGATLELRSYPDA